MPPSPKQDRTPEIRITAGPRAAESELLADLELATDGELDLAPGPILLVVPSRSLSQHLQARIAAVTGRALLGVRCTTLFGLAREITEDLGGRLLGGSDVFPLFARRLARSEPALARALAPLNDGFSTLLGAVRDLFDAGLDPAHREALSEALAEEGRTVASRQEVERAIALVRVATGCLEQLTNCGAGRRSTLLQAASELLRHGEPAMQVRAVWIHGFADATGVATDFIEALLNRYTGRLYLDRPPDPAAPEQADAGAIFTRRFRERLEVRARTVESTRRVAPPDFELFRALGSDGELREVGYRIRKLIDNGSQPESIAVVARQLTGYTRALRIQFDHLGLPYSMHGAHGAKNRRGRRAEALAELVTRRGKLPIERWLELNDRRFGGRPSCDLRTGFATLGLGRLSEVAELATDSYRLEHDLVLPVRQGFAELTAGTADGRGLRLRRRRLPAAALRAAVEAAQALLAHFERWQQAESLTQHQAAYRALLSEHLGWGCAPDSATSSASLVTLGDAVWNVLPADEPLSLDEYTDGLALSLRELGTTQLGGNGGGVQVMDAVEARGRTCEHLFLVGLNRGSFPRIVREDPLLPDALRTVLGRQGFGVLPDLRGKREGFDEERFLFAQLIASSPRITLSWQDTDDDQQPLAPSPLLERLRWVRADNAWHAPELARPVVAQRSAVPRSPFENALAVALDGSRQRLAEALPRLLPQGELPANGAALAGARLAVLDEIDPPAGSGARNRLGPYFGFVGAAGDDDPRRQQPIYITALERLAGCPWQAFLQRILRLEPVPDPLAALPGITPLLIGALVHEVLEDAVRLGWPDPPRDLTTARHTLPHTVPWPGDKELDRILFGAAERLCRNKGIAVSGFARLLAEACRPYLEQAHTLDWPAADSLHVLGVELEGQVEISDPSGRDRAIRFRADRLDLRGESLVLTDYKTGRRTVSSAKQPRWQRKHLVASVASGERLQAVAYALGAGESVDRGRYLFLHPETDGDRAVREVEIRADDEQLVSAFSAAASAALGAWDSGAFFPRLVDPDRDEEPFRCQYCDVRDACVRGDSGARGRLRRTMEHRYREFSSGQQLSPAELLLLTLWRLPAAGGR